MIPSVIDFAHWVHDHEGELKPPVNNKQLWTDVRDLMVQVVGGPNQRTDFHVDPYEEWFYQVKGSMHVNVMTESGLRRIDIGPGEMWMLPRGVPHSPQRPEPGSIGLVLERIREPETLESFRWYCFECSSLVHEVELIVRDIVADLPPVFESFYHDEAARTCDACGALHPGRAGSAS